MYALQPLDISEYSGPGVGYNIYFKKETDPKDFFHVSDLLVRLYILFKRALSVWVFFVVKIDVILPDIVYSFRKLGKLNAPTQ